MGKTSRPAGAYTADLLATDLHALLLSLSISTFHLLGVSMGGMIAQAYALAHPNPPRGSDPPTRPTMLSLTLACTYASPTPFCTRMFALWADMATRMSVADVMRDVLLWCFTVPYFLLHEDKVCDIERAMAAAVAAAAGPDAQEDSDLPTTSQYLSQLNVIQDFDSRAALRRLGEQGEVLGGLSGNRIVVVVGEEDILIPVVVSKMLFGLVQGMGARWIETRGGHACTMEFPDEFNQRYVAFLKGL